MPRTKTPKRRLNRRTAEVSAAMATAPDDLLLTTPQVAEWFDVSEVWLEIGRLKGWGPKFVKMGPRLVRYTVGSCRQYLAECTYGRNADYQKREEAVA